jgi:small subunit ribosomal protein S20
MANTKSAKKRVRQTIRKTARNRDAMSQIRTALKKAYDLIQENAKEAEDAVLLAIRKLMKAGGRGIMHSNTVSRHVSRLSVAHAASLKGVAKGKAAAKTTKKKKKKVTKKAAAKGAKKKVTKKKKATKKKKTTKKKATTKK